MFNPQARKLLEEEAIASIHRQGVTKPIPDKMIAETTGWNLAEILARELKMFVGGLAEYHVLINQQIPKITIDDARDLLFVCRDGRKEIQKSGGIEHSE